MALTEIETDTGLELAYDGGAAKTPPAVSFQAGLSRRQRPQPVTEVEYVPQEAPQKSRRGQRRFRKNRLVNNGVREREEGKTDPPLRPFQMKWLLLYPWLRYEIATKFMHCAWCMESGKKNAFGKNGGKLSLFSWFFRMMIWLIDWSIDWLFDWLIDWLTDWLIDWLTDWLIDWLIDWLFVRLIEKRWFNSVSSEFEISRISVRRFIVSFFIHVSILYHRHK